MSPRVTHDGVVNRVFTVRHAGDEWEFPLRAEFVKANRTLEGIQRQAMTDDQMAAEREIAEMERAGREQGVSLPPEGPPSAPPQVEDGRPPRPTGPDDYVFHNGKWRLPRGGMVA